MICQSEILPKVGSSGDISISELKSQRPMKAGTFFYNPFMETVK
jgi:hypothetical protein